jgi:hypothetical protein
MVFSDLVLSAPSLPLDRIAAEMEAGKERDYVVSVLEEQAAGENDAR